MPTHALAVPFPPPNPTDSIGEDPHHHKDDHHTTPLSLTTAPQAIPPETTDIKPKIKTPISAVASTIPPTHLLNPIAHQIVQQDVAIPPL